ncbi:MAG: thioesterase domain-containing protein [Byssovorax sp.]
MPQRPSEPKLRSLVAIRAEGAGTPFFCVPAFGSDIEHYRLLSRHVGPSRRFYVLISQGFDGSVPPHDKIEDMAASYIEQIRVVQPHGPYFVGGASSGGTVAWEMAQQLHAMGEPVGLLLLIDAFHRGHERYQPDPRPGRTGVDTLLSRFDFHVGNLVTRDRKAQIEYISSLVRGRLQRAGMHLPALVGGETPEERRSTLFQRVREANLRALTHYFPERYPGKATLFYCTGESIRTFKDRRLLWSGLAADGLELRLLEGEHETLLEEPNVALLGEELRAVLDRADREIARTPSAA